MPSWFNGLEYSSDMLKLVDKEFKGETLSDHEMIRIYFSCEIVQI